MEWGDLRFKDEPTGDFISRCIAKDPVDVSSFLNKSKEVQVKTYHSVDSRDIKLFYLQK